jgi:DNA repair photolyase
VVESRPGFNKPVQVVRVRRGLREHLRFFHTVDPAITRKMNIEGQALKQHPLRIVSIESLGVLVRMYDITTGTGDFIANGVVSHNCYARPTHEYLDFGAGTDWETKIVVKPRAAELLREAFDKPKWKGDFVLFSGVTDCYQPLEASYRLTRACLEVCAEYRNPVGVITKAPLVERDIDVLQELHRVARVSVTLSIPFRDPDVARAIEPWVATPARRLKAIERMAAAGIPVGINIAPVIPALNDGDIPRLLEAARDAGATHAGWVLLRLPGSVKAVFEERLRAALPLRADRVMARIRETRGGALYDTRWRVRQRGEGEYAAFIGQLFAGTKQRLGYPVDDEDSDPPTTFRRPKRLVPGSQLALFPDRDESDQ